MSVYLIDHDCRECKYRANGTHQHPCNKCYSRNGNCTQQFFLDKNLSHKPMSQAPANDIDLLTMSVDQLMYENRVMSDQLQQLRKEHDKLMRELARGNVPGPIYDSSDHRCHVNEVKVRIRKQKGGSNGWRSAK